jgi:hypothetical protein
MNHWCINAPFDHICVYARDPMMPRDLRCYEKGFGDIGSFLGVRSERLAAGLGLGRGSEKVYDDLPEDATLERVFETAEACERVQTRTGWEMAVTGMIHWLKRLRGRLLKCQERREMPAVGTGPSNPMSSLVWVNLSLHCPTRVLTSSTRMGRHLTSSRSTGPRMCRYRRRCTGRRGRR